MLLAAGILLGHVCGLAQSRTVRGTAYHAISGKPLPGIPIAIRGAAESARTDWEGHYELRVPDTVGTTGFKAIPGMTIVEARTVSPGVIDLYISEVDFLDLSLSELMSVRVTTASKTPEKITGIPASVVVITRADIATYGYQTLEELLAHIAGLYMIDDYYWLGSVNYGVRGFFTNEPFNNIILMVNDVNQMEEYSRGAPLTKVGVPVEAIHHIEVIRGPMSVIYGSGAFMGAINIITSQNDRTMLSATVGSGSSRKLYMRYYDSLGVSNNFSLTASVHRTDGIDVPYTDLTTNPVGGNGRTFLENNGLRNDATTSDQLNDRRFYVNAHYKAAHFTFDGTYTANKAGMFDGQPTLGEGNFFLNNSITLMGQFDRTVADGLSLRIKETYSGYSDMIDYEQDYLNTNKGSRQLSSFLESELNVFYTPSPALSMLAGLYNRYITAYSWHGNYTPAYGPDYTDFLTTIEKPYMFNAVFFQGTYTPGEKFTIVGGCRLEQSTPFEIRRVNDLDSVSIVRTYAYEYDDVNLLPRLALIYAADRNHIVKFLFGTAIKQPSMASLQPYALHPEWATLRPATIMTYEVNYLSHASRFITANLSVFYNDITDLIVRKDETQPDGTLKIESSNAGKMHSLGIECGMNLSPAKDVSIDISGTYQQSKDRSAGMEAVDLGYSPAFLGYGRVAYRPGRFVSLGLSYRYVGGMEAYYENTSSFTGRIGAAAPAYSVVDVNVSFPEIARGISANLKVNNLLDAEIRYPTTLAGSIWDKGTLGRPRMAYLTLAYAF